MKLSDLLTIKKNIFISYDYDNDRAYKNLLLAWDAHKKFEFNFTDHSADISINSTNAAVIKRAITIKINNAKYFLCIVGKNTYKSNWVGWEIKKAVELKKKIIIVKTNKENLSPPSALNVGAAWAMSFTFDAIKTAIDNA